MIGRYLKNIYWSIVHSGAWRPFKNMPFIWTILSRIDNRLTFAPGTLHEVFPDAEKKHITPSETVETPEAMEMSFFARGQHFRQSTYQTPELYIASVPNALYCPVNHVLLNEKRDIFRAQEKRRNRIRRLDQSALARQSRGYIEGPALTLRSIEPGYYHTLIENLPRLAYLSEQVKPDISVKLIRPADGPAIMRRIEDFVIPRLLSNFQVVDVPTDRIYKIDKLIHIPHPTRHRSGYIPRHLLQSYRNRLLPVRSSQRKNRIYISRERTTARRVLNEDELVPLLSERGFVKYNLEDLSIEEQIKLFHDAEAVVAPHGAGLTNLLFAPERTPVLELFPTRHVVPHFYFLAKALRHRYTYWYDPSNAEQKDPWKANFRVAPHEIVERIDEVLSPRNVNSVSTVDS